MNFDRRYMVAQYLCRLGSSGKIWDVLATGEPGWVLFRHVAGCDALGLGGWNDGIEVPVKRTSLKRHIAKLIPRP